MTADQRVMLPAQMPVIGIDRESGRVVWYPSGVFGEWQDFKDINEALDKVKDFGPMLLTVSK